jgi:Rod binding domain-containing protein
MPTQNLPNFDGVSMSGLQNAFALKPGLVSQAANQAVNGSPMSALGSSNSFSPVQGLNPLTGPKTHTEAQLKEVSRNFESIFIQMMFKEMRHSIQKSNLFGNSQATEFFESMQDEQLSKQLASSGGIGIGNVIYQKLKQVTEPHIKRFS